MYKKCVLESNFLFHLAMTSHLSSASERVILKVSLGTVAFITILRLQAIFVLLI